MELYVLDDTLRRMAVVDDYISLVWTERFKDTGDFKTTLHTTQAKVDLFKPNTMVITNDSYRVMVVENVEEVVDTEGHTLLNVSGKSLEKILMDRAAIKSMASGARVPWVITDTPANVARIVFETICVDHTANPGDFIPFMEEGSIFPADGILEPSNVITYTVPSKSVYEVIKEICDIYELGFRLVRNPESGLLSFNIYSGSKLTASQSSRPAVVFSKNLDNLTNTKDFTSVENQKNTAYVVHPDQQLMVYNLGESDSTTIWFARKVMVVDASELTSTGATLLAEMQQMGEAALAEQRGLKAFDGEINPVNGYRYGRDYNLGDLVEQRSTSSGITNEMRVTEQILSSDAQGDKSYPTITMSLSITPGSWLSWDPNEVWLDYEGRPSEVWANQI